MVKIEIVQDLKQKMKQDNEYVRAVLNGKRKLKKSEKTIVITPNTFSKIFSTQRLNLLLQIKHDRSKNIYQLAKELGRSYEAVHRDIKLLEGFGIIKVRSADKRRYPYMEHIQMPIFAKA